MRDQTSNPTFTHTYTLQTLPRFFPVGAPGRLSAAANARLIASSRTPLADLPSAALALASAEGWVAAWVVARARGTLHTTQRTARVPDKRCMRWLSMVLVVRRMLRLDHSVPRACRCRGRRRSRRGQSRCTSTAQAAHTARRRPPFHRGNGDAEPGRSDRLRESAPTTARNVSYSNTICGMSHPFRQLWV